MQLRTLDADVEDRIGEKMLAWSDQDPPLEKILETVTLYWMTDTISRSFWHNRAMAGADDEPKMARLWEF